MSIGQLTNTTYYSQTSSNYSTSQTNNSNVNSEKINAQADVNNTAENSTTTNTTTISSQTTVSNNNETYNGLTGEEILASDPNISRNETESDDTNTEGLTEEEQEQVKELQNRDREVKTHEQAHVAAGGQYVKGGPSYEYQTGPDGRQYAVGGSVNIDTSPIEGDPQATITKAQVVIKAAMAPAEPSSQDKAVANQARQMMSEAQKELNSEKINGENNKEASSYVKNSSFDTDSNQVETIIKDTKENTQTQSNTDKTQNVNNSLETTKENETENLVKETTTADLSTNKNIENSNVQAKSFSNQIIQNTYTNKQLNNNISFVA